MQKIKDLKEAFSWNFTFFLLGNSTSKFGTTLYQVILAWWIVEETGSARAFGYISFASLLPIVLFNFFSGVIVDRFNRKNILIYADLISGITCVAVAYIAFTDTINIPLLILASFLLGASSSLFGPAVKAIIPEIVGKENITRCNSVNTTVGQLITVIAPITAGLLIDNLKVGIAFIFLINGISFILSAVCEKFLRYEYIRTFEKKDSYWANIKEGFAYMKTHNWLLNLLIVSALVNIFISSYNVLLPLYIKETYSNNALLYGQGLTAEAIGGIVGGAIIFLGKKSDPNTKLIASNLFLCGLSVLLLQIFNNKFIMLSSIFLFGYFLTRFNVLFFSLVQTKVDKNMLGRVFSFIIMISLSTMPISNLLFGFLGDYILDYVYIISGIGICIASMLTLNKYGEKKNNLMEMYKYYN